MLIALMLSALLKCTMPSEFFWATNGTQKVLDKEVPQLYVYDTASTTNKSLRISRYTGAFYYSLLSGILEREILFHNFGRLRNATADGVENFTTKEAFAYMKTGDLGEVPSWMTGYSAGERRIVKQMNDMFRQPDIILRASTNWYFRRVDQEGYTRYQYLAPTIFTNNNVLGSRDFPNLGIFEPESITNELSITNLMYTWNTWIDLDDNYMNSFGARARLSSPVLDALNCMAKNASNDKRPNAPGNIGFTPDGIPKVGLSTYDILERITPNCFSHMTNQTMRFDYKKCAALSCAMGIDDRIIQKEPFGELKIDQERGETNKISTTVKQTIYAIATNMTFTGFAYDSSAQLMRGSVFVRPDDILVTQSVYSIITNYEGPGTLISVNTSPTYQSNKTSSTITLQATFPASELLQYGEEGKTYNISSGAWYNQSPSVLKFDIDGENYHTQYAVSLNEFEAKNNAVPVEIRRQSERTWTLSPLDLSDLSRCPSPMTHDVAPSLYPYPDGSLPINQNKFPKWLFGTNSIVKCIGLGLFGNIIVCPNVVSEEVSYTYDPYASEEDQCKIRYISMVDNGQGNDHYIKYDDFFNLFWNEIDNIKKAAFRLFAQYAGSSADKPWMMRDAANPQKIVADFLTASEWGPLTEQSSCAIFPTSYEKRNNEIVSPGTTTPIQEFTVTLLLFPPLNSESNKVDKALSVGVNLNYMNSFYSDFKNLNSPQPIIDPEETSFQYPTTP